MRILFLKSMWEMDGIPFETRLQAIKEAGYDGFELYVRGALPVDFDALLKEYELVWVAQMIHSSIEEFQTALRTVLEHKPLRIVLHGGRDHFTTTEGTLFLTKALAIERQIGVQVAHETHRHRLLYSPWVAREYLKMFPELKLNADFSHWCVVTESMMEDQDELMELATARSIHIHARVGHAEGPQVSDPRAPEFADALRRHEAWWDMVRAAMEKRGEKTMAVTAEFGPVPYQPALPYTGMPVADIWEVNHWMMHRLRKRWGA